MKKLVLLIIVLLLAGLLIYKLRSGKEENKAAPPDQALKINKNTGVFNTAFSEMMSAYFNLKDALVEWDTIKADQAAYILAQRADSLPVGTIRGDSNIVNTARSLAASIGGDAQGLVGEGDIVQKRRALNILTDELYNLVRTVRYDGEIIYHVRCPMAFNDSEEGYWLSNNPKIINPYLGDKHPVYKAKMIGCGEISDSLDFTKK